MIKIHIDEEAYKRISQHLFSRKAEQVAFIYMQLSENNILIIDDYFCVPPEELVYESEYHAEITSKVQARVIKESWDKKRHLGEIHTHPFSKKETTFSGSDMAGFNDFVPHIWWRLRGGPYVAIVFGQNDFDIIAWVQSPNSPERVASIKVGDKLLYPNNLFFEDKYE